MCEYFMKNCGKKKKWLLHYDNTPFNISLFNMKFFINKRLIVVPTLSTHLTLPLKAFLFPWFKIKLKGRHFDTTEASEGGSQALLKTLIEQDFKDAFKKWQKLWEWCACTVGGYFECDGCQWAQVSF
jgi:hypothetical protein